MLPKLAMSRATFTVKFEGPAVVSGEIDARELAGQLFALADVLEESGDVLSEGRVQVRSRVVANFEEGSFIYHLATEMHLLDAAKQILIGDDVTAGLNAAQILTLLFGCASGTVVGLIGLTRKLKGKAPKTAIRAGHNITIVTEEDEEFSIESRLFNLYRKRSIRRSVAEFTKPLLKEGVERIVLSSDQVPMDSVAKDEVKSFQELPPMEETTSQHSMESVGLFGIVSAVFKKGNKWRLVTGAGEAFVAIEDKAFLQKVQDGEVSFSAGDLLKARFRQEMTTSPSGVKGEMAIVEVLEHLKGEKPMRDALLPFDEDR